MNQIDIKRLIDIAIQQPDILYATLHDIELIKWMFNNGLSTNLKDKYEKSYWYREPMCNASHKLSNILEDFSREQTKELIQALGKSKFHEWCIANGRYIAL